MAFHFSLSQRLILLDIVACFLQFNHHIFVHHSLQLTFFVKFDLLCNLELSVQLDANALLLIVVQICRPFDYHYRLLNAFYALVYHVEILLVL